MCNEVESTPMSDIPYSIIKVSGPDALDFLQAQLAADLDALPEHGLAAWCNPKGRVICLFRVRRSGDTFELAVPDELAEDILKRLTMFRFRAKVDLELGAASAGQLGVPSSYDDWRLDNLRAGIAEILKAQSEEWTPHMLNLDLLGAVSIDKGCYPGQEIVARTHYRGKTKRRCHRFESSQPVAAGAKVSDGTRDVGEVVNAIGNELLAVVPSDLANQELTVNGNALLKLTLPYFEQQ